MISDLFKPKWKNSDTTVRLAGVQMLKNQKILARIASFDNDTFVRDAAMSRINNQKYIAFVARYGLYEEQRAKSLELLNVEDEILLEIIKSDTSSLFLKELSIRKIKQQTLLADLAENGPTTEIRIMAIRYLKAKHYRPLLIKICCNDSDENICKEALKKIIDQKHLCEIVRKNPNSKVRGKLLDIIYDQKTIEEVAKTDKVSELRIKAIKKLNSQDELYKIFVNDPDNEVRIQALEKLNKQNFLSEIVKNHPIAEIRSKALDKLKDQEAIACVAKNDDVTKIREKAIQKLQLQKVLYEIVTTDPDEEVRWQAIEKLNKQNYLAEIARNSANAEIRKKAIQKLNLQNVLYEIAANDVDEDTQMLALEKLNEQNYLAEIARNNLNVEIRKKAIQKLDLQNVLYEIILNDSNELVCLSAINKIEAVDKLFNVVLSSSFYDIKKASIEKILNWFREKMEGKGNFFQIFENFILSELVIQDSVNLFLMQFLFITIMRCDEYQKLVQYFFNNFAFKLGPKIYLALSAHFNALAIENKYITHKNDIVRLFYQLEPENPIYTQEALNFETQLENAQNLQSNYDKKYELYLKAFEEYQAEYEQYIKELEQYSTDCELYNKECERIRTSYEQYCEIHRQLHTKHKEFPKIIVKANKSQINELKHLEKFICQKKEVIDGMLIVLGQMEARIKERKKEIDKMLVTIKRINEPINGMKEKIARWLKDNEIQLSIIETEENNARIEIVQKKYGWKRNNSKFFEVCINLLRENEMIYEASCFCESIAESFSNVAFPKNVKSIMIRSHANFLKLVYKKLVQRIDNDENKKYEVQGPTYFTIMNNVIECNLSFLIMGPTVEQIVLRGGHQTSIKVQPGWYTLICQSTDSKSIPAILEGNCLPGRYYSFLEPHKSNDISTRNYAPLKLGEGCSIDEGLWGAIDIDPTLCLYLLYNGRKYHIENYLGGGSGGVVYKAREEETGMVSAFKFMTTAPIGGGYTQIEFGKKEWLAYNNLAYKQNIVSIFSYSEYLEFFQQNKALKKKKAIAAYEMEYAHFGNLKEYVEKHTESALPIEAVLNITKEISIGLEAIHKSGLIHRDLRPENVLVFQDSPQYRICDFTLTRNKQDLITEQLEGIFSKERINIFVDNFSERQTISTLQSFKEIVCSSTFYASPEEHAGHVDLDARSDIYSAGGILYWLLVGFEPFELLLREYDRNLYERYRLAKDCELLNIDAMRSRQLFGEWTQLRNDLRKANLRLKENSMMEIDYEEIDCPGITEFSFGIIKDFLSKTLHPDPNKRFQSAAELRCAIEDMENYFKFHTQ